MGKKVSLVKYETGGDSLMRAVDLCEGLSELKPSDSVLIKPNLVAWDNQFPIAPYGVFTTTALVEDLVILLKDRGCKHIVIAEGSVEINGLGTMDAFEGLGYKQLEKRYGVELVDFNQSETVKFEVTEHIKLRLAKEAVETDFFIDLPVLKTHAQTKVSLGIKNLKGCLKIGSKKFCHHTDMDLEYCFSHIPGIVKPALSIVDGIYALEKGALHYGNAYRKDLIVASKDLLGADLVAAKSIGFAPEEIGHFTHLSHRMGCPCNLDDYELVGDDLEDHTRPLKWDWTWTQENTGPKIFEKFGISGVALPKYDDTLCSGCSPIANMSNILALSAFKGAPLPNVEILNGKKMQGRPGYSKTVLLGDCIIKANKNNENIQEAIPVKGCPPEFNDVCNALKQSGLEINELAYFGYLKQQSEKYDGKDGYLPSLYKAR